MNLNDIVLGSLRSASLGYYGFESTTGGGRMTEAVRLAIDHGFGELRSSPSRGEHPAGQRPVAGPGAAARIQARGFLSAISVRSRGVAGPRALGGAERRLAILEQTERRSDLSFCQADLQPA